MLKYITIDTRFFLEKLGKDVTRFKCEPMYDYICALLLNAQVPTEKESYECPSKP